MNRLDYLNALRGNTKRLENKEPDEFKGVIQAMPVMFDRLNECQEELRNARENPDFNFFKWMVKKNGYDLDKGDWLFLGEDFLKAVPELEDWRGTNNVFISNMFQSMYIIPKEFYEKARKLYE